MDSELWGIFEHLLNQKVIVHHPAKTPADRLSGGRTIKTFVTKESLHLHTLLPYSFPIR